MGPFLLLALTLSVFSAGAGLAPVEAVHARSAAEVENPVLRAFLQRNEMELYDQRQFWAKEHYGSLKKLLEKLLLPQDGTEKIHFVLIDDQGVNAFFTKLSNGERAVGITVGALRFLENDDSIAFVLGHELEHGPSDLQKEIDELKKDKKYQSTGERIQTALLAQSLQRIVENEVDVKSTLRRVIDNGFNPYAPYRVLERFQTEFPRGVTATHSTSGSRKDSVGLALAYLVRQEGRRLKPNSPEAFSHAISQPLKEQWVESRAFFQDQIDRAERSLLPDSTAIEKLYADAKQGRYDGGYEGMFTNHWRDLNRLAKGILSDEELIDLQVKLHSQLLEAFEKARAKVLGKKFTTDKPYVFDAIEKLENPNLRYFAPDPVMALAEKRNLEETLVRSAKHRDESKSWNISGVADRDQYEAEQDKENGYWVKETKAKIAQHEREIALGLRVYDGVTEADLIPLAGDAYTDMGQRGDAARERFRKGMAKLKRKLKAIGPVMGRGKKRSKRFVERSARGAIGPQQSLAAMRSHLAKVETPAALVPQDLKSYLDLVESRLAAAHDLEKRTQVFDTFLNEFSIGRKDRNGSEHVIGLEESPLNRVLNELPENERAETTRRILRMVMTHAKDPALINKFLVANDTGYPPGFKGAKNLFDSRGYTEFKMESAAFKLAFTPEFTREYLGAVQRLLFPTLESAKSTAEINEVLRRYENRLRPLLQSPQREAIQSDPALMAAQEAFLARGTQKLEQLNHGKLDPKDIRIGLEVNFPTLSRMGADISDSRAREILSRLEVLGATRDACGTLCDSLSAAEIARLAHLVDVGPETDLFARLNHVLRFRKPLNPYTYGSETYEPPNLGRPLDLKRLAKNLTLEHPDKIGLIAKVVQAPNFNRDYGSSLDGDLNFYLPVLDALEAKYQHLPHREKTRAMVADFYYGHFPEARFRGSYDSETEGRYSRPSGETYHEGTIKGAFYSRRLKQSLAGKKTSTNDLLNFTNGYLDGREEAFQRLAKERNRVPELLLAIAGARRENPENQALDHITYHDVDLSKADPKLLVETFHRLRAYRPSAEKLDQALHNIWPLLEKHPELLKTFEDPNLIGQLYWDKTRTDLAKWQLSRKFPELAARREPTPKGEISTLSKEALAFVNEQFPKQSFLKNQVLEHVENRLLTNEAETNYFGKHKVNMENAYKDRKLALLDLLHVMNQKQRHHYDRFKVITYLIGVSNDLIDTGNNNVRPDKVRRLFKEASEPARIFALQSFLDHKEGVLAEPELREDLIDLILGENKDQKVLRKIFSAYLQVVPENEQKAILGKILSGFVDSPTRSTSLKKVLEALGPFGIKAGQFLSSSGLTTPEMRRELKDFFDRAMPVSRDTMFQRLREVFGEKGDAIVGVRDILGSGSINYVVLVDFKDPQTGKIRPAVVRIRRENVEGRLHNENENWKHVAEVLHRDSDPEIRAHARTMDEVRTHAWKTLAPEGSEMDHALDRSAFGKAEEGYRSEPASDTGFRVRAVAPDEVLQSLVPETLSREISIYEHVPSTRLDDMTDKALRSKLIGQILKAELEALFTHGIYDPDGHPGNWLVNLETKEIVRIDYAQLKQISPEAREALADIFRALIRPHPDQVLLEALARNLHHVLDNPPPVETIHSRLSAIIHRKDFPSYTHPEERAFFLRSQLEAELQAEGQETSVRLHAGFRDALGSLTRLLSYEEYVGKKPLTKQFLSTLAINELALAPNYVRHKVHQAATVVSAVCRKALSLVKSKK